MTRPRHPHQPVTDVGKRGNPPHFLTFLSSSTHGHSAARAPRLHRHPGHPAGSGWLGAAGVPRRPLAGRRGRGVPDTFRRSCLEPAGQAKTRSIHVCRPEVGARRDAGSLLFEPCDLVLAWPCGWKSVI